MKPITRIFILAQTLDLALTFYAIRMGIAFEMNPIGFTVDMVLTKFAAILFVAWVIENKDLPRISWIIPIISVLVVVWNGFVIVMETLT